jgi:hypothetical protein
LSGERFFRDGPNSGLGRRSDGYLGYAEHMATMSRQAADVSSPDPSWRGLYLAGSVSGVLFVVLNIAAIVILAIMPPTPSAGGAATLQ